MELSEAMRTTAGVRLYESRDVSDEVIYRALELARFAPSGGNRQPWRVVVVRDDAVRARIREISIREWERYVTTWYDDVESLSEKRLRKLHEGAAYHETLDSAPVHLLIWTELAALAVTDRDLERQSFVGGGSIYPFIHNVQLALRSEGVGSRITSLAVAAESEMASLVDVPEELGLAAVMTVGYPEWAPTKLSRNPVESFAWHEKFEGVPLR
jgi:nitroreductase